MSPRRARVERVAALAKRIADARDPLGNEARRDILATSGLSPEGVALALEEHLEVDPSDADLDALVASMREAPRCHVVLSANVCTAPLRALACAVATAPQVFVRPSRRDPALAALLVREVASDDGFAALGGSIALVETIAPAAGDEVHVYGSDESLRAIAASLPEGVILSGHGTGLGVAVVGLGTDLDEAAHAIARDVIAFDQRGCLSPRAVLVDGDEGRANALFSSLDRALTELSLRVPRGPIGADVAAEITRYVMTMAAVGLCNVGEHHAIGLDVDPRALLLPPAARVVHVARTSPEDAPALLAPWADFITTIGVDESALAHAVVTVAPHARHARLGAMQRPRLDGPVDLRRRVAGERGLS